MFFIRSELRASGEIHPLKFWGRVPTSSVSFKVRNGKGNHISPVFSSKNARKGGLNNVGTLRIKCKFSITRNINDIEFPAICISKGVREHLCKGGGTFGPPSLTLCPHPLKTGLYWKNIDTFFSCNNFYSIIYTHLPYNTLVLLLQWVKKRFLKTFS